MNTILILLLVLCSAFSQTSPVISEKTDLQNAEVSPLVEAAVSESSANHADGNQSELPNPEEKQDLQRGQDSLLQQTSSTDQSNQIDSQQSYLLSDPETLNLPGEPLTLPTDNEQPLNFAIVTTNSDTEHELLSVEAQNQEIMKQEFPDVDSTQLAIKDANQIKEDFYPADLVMGVANRVSDVIGHVFENLFSSPKEKTEILDVEQSTDYLKEELKPVSFLNKNKKLRKQNQKSKKKVHV